jgi:chromosome segregation ATPase
MFKFIGKSIVLSALGVGALGLLYGKDQVMTWARQGREKIKTEINEMQGMNSELRSIETRVGALETEVRGLKENAIREEVEVQHLESETAERSKNLDHLKSNLEKAQTLLTSGAERFRIGRVEYARADVERDVGDKIELYKVQQETLDQLNATLETHRSAVALAKENVARGEALKTELAGKVRLLQAKLEKHRAREVYAEAVACDFDANDFNTQIGEVRQLFAKFETKLEVKSRLLDERMKVAVGTHVNGIDYEAKDGSVSKNVVDQLNELFAAKAAPVAAPAAPSTVVVVTGR